MKPNRLDPVYLKTWHEDYRNLFSDFSAGHIPLLGAIECLRHLGFKDDALRIEILELHKARREAKGPAFQLIAS